MEDSWPHAPPHFLHEPGTYMVTARTYQSQHHFGSRLRLRYLTAELLRYAANNGWKIEAWAVLANHYHWVGKSPNAGAGNLGSWLGELHAITAGHVNRLDKTTGRKVWHNYRESLITYEKSYLARLRYVMQNPVKHGLVERAEDYPWCSASWFSENASLAFQKSLAGFKINRLNIDDDD